MTVEMTNIQYCVPLAYISAGTPNNVIPDTCEAIKEAATGKKFMVFPPSKYSSVLFCFRLEIKPK